jgi:asparagine synthase (glutamine-hydrolysing)
MPGIVGLITRKPRQWAEAQLLRMVEALRHESFYVTGTWIDESLGVYVGWAVRGNSFSDNMPIRNESGDVVLVFAGEDYPKSGTRRHLKKHGDTREEDDGPSYLVQLYQEDPNFFKQLNGRFQGLLVDRHGHLLTLFNDRYGLNRLYYHEGQEAFYFSAEAKAILAVRPELRSIEPRSLGEYVACGCVLENRTLFRQIHVLPPGSAWVFCNGILKTKAAYFEPREWEEQEPLDYEDYYARLRDTLTDSLPRYFNGRENIGVSLTGGLDTRIIMAWHKAPAGALPCYTFGSMYRENQDVYLARRVAKICGQSHQVITAGREFLAHFPHYAERTLYLTDGCVDTSRSADLYANELARQIAAVRMVGTFGSEILCGLLMFKPVLPAAGIFQAPLQAEVLRAVATYHSQFGGNSRSAVAFRQTSTFHVGGLMLEQTQLTVRSPFLDNDFVQTAFRAPRTNRNDDVRLRLIREGSPTLAGLRTDRGLAAVPNRLVSALKRKYLEFTFKAEYAYDYGMPQWVAQLDHFFGFLHLERIWLGRHKLFHFRYWYRTFLAQYVREILLDRRTLTRPYLQPKAVEKIVRSHLSGERNYTTEIHRLLSVELLHRLFVDPV